MKLSSEGLTIHKKFYPLESIRGVTIVKYPGNRRHSIPTLQISLDKRVLSYRIASGSLKNVQHWSNWCDIPFDERIVVSQK